MESELSLSKKEERNDHLYLFVSFGGVGMFSFGGGYAAMPLIHEQVVTIHHWMDISEFTDLVTISQMTPGPISINGRLLLESNCRDSGCNCSYRRMCPAILCDRYDH